MGSRPWFRRRWLGVAAALVLGVLGATGASADASAKTPPLTGTVIAANRASFTVEQPGKAKGAINTMLGYATKLAAKNYPYVYGGGHGTPGVPTTGTAGRSTNGFDCSGAVAAVLASAGIWPKNAPVPGDAAVITDLMQAHKIANGPGVGPDTVDLFDRPGDDIQMNIEGDFFGTGYTRRGGPGWMGKFAARFPGSYKEYHVLPSVLKDSSSYRQEITFEYPESSPGAKLAQEIDTGAKVQVSYRQSGGVNIVTAAKNIGGKPFKKPNPYVIQF